MAVVLAGGCFNHVHAGHAYFLKQAKKHGDMLIVVLASDATNKKKYGCDAVPAETRMKALMRLGIADKVVIGSDKEFGKVVDKEKPDVIALGYDQMLPAGISAKKVVRIGKYV